jgi:hypothetical protein
LLVFSARFNVNPGLGLLHEGKTASNVYFWTRSLSQNVPSFSFYSLSYSLQLTPTPPPFNNPFDFKQYVPFSKDSGSQEIKMSVCYDGFNESFNDPYVQSSVSLDAIFIIFYIIIFVAWFIVRMTSLSQKSILKWYFFGLSLAFGIL